MVSQVVVVVKNSPANAGEARDLGLIPGSGRSPGKGNAAHSNILAWKNSMGRGDGWATVHGATKSWDTAEQLKTAQHVVAGTTWEYH